MRIDFLFPSQLNQFVIGEKLALGEDLLRFLSLLLHGYVGWHACIIDHVFLALASIGGRLAVGLEQLQGLATFL